MPSELDELRTRVRWIRDALNNFCDQCDPELPCDGRDCDVQDSIAECEAILEGEPSPNTEVRSTPGVLDEEDDPRR